MSPIQVGIIKTLAYFSIFKHPLKVDEIHRFLLFEKCQPEEIYPEIEMLKKSGKIFELNGFYLLEKREEWVKRRINGEKLALRLWKIAQFMAHIIKRFPYTRGVFVSGSLAKLNVDRATDIDFFIITKKSRLWLCRSLLIAFKKTFLLNSRKFFCLNYFRSEDSLEIEDKNIFTAVELATLKPVFNVKLYQKFLSDNLWIKNFLPNFEVGKIPLPAISEKRSLLQTVFETFTDSKFSNRWTNGFLDRFDLSLMRKWERIWAKRYPQFTDEERDLMFRCRPWCSKMHPKNFQKFVLEKFNEMLERYL